MTSVLSVTAIARFVEQRVDLYGPQRVVDLELALERLGVVESERIKRGIDFAVVVRRRVKLTTGDDGEPLLARSIWWVSA